MRVQRILLWMKSNEVILDAISFSLIVSDGEVVTPPSHCFSSLPFFSCYVLCLLVLNVPYLDSEQH